MTTNVNYKVSTITDNDLFPVALKAVQRFVKGSNRKRLIRYFGSYYTLEDLAMEAVEKVLKAKPVYLTKTYVNMAATCACIDRLQSPKLPWQDVAAYVINSEGDKTPPEELIEGDAYDTLSDLEMYVKSQLSPVLLDTYLALQEEETYVESANKRNISTRTLERRVAKLKITIDSLLAA